MEAHVFPFSFSGSLPPCPQDPPDKFPPSLLFKANSFEFSGSNSGMSFWLWPTSLSRGHMLKFPWAGSISLIGVEESILRGIYLFNMIRRFELLTTTQEHLTNKHHSQTNLLKYTSWNENLGNIEGIPCSSEKNTIHWAKISAFIYAPPMCKQT